jgi:hypothetical protein
LKRHWWQDQKGTCSFHIPPNKELPHPPPSQPCNLPDAHDEVDHGDGVQMDAPEGHEAQHPHLDGDDGEGNPEGADGVGDEDEGDDHHDDGRDHHALDGGREHHQELW